MDVSTDFFFILLGLSKPFQQGAQFFLNSNEDILQVAWYIEPFPPEGTISGSILSGPSWDVTFTMDQKAVNLVRRDILGRGPVPGAITSRVPRLGRSAPSFSEEEFL